MKVILTQPVDKLGKPGDVVKVADGFGRNFLLPRHLAIVADKGSMKQVERIASDHERKEARFRTDAESIAKRLRAHPIRIEARAGAETTKLYGSVTAIDIAHAIQEQIGIEVDRRKVELEEPIRNLGEYSIAVRLHSEVIAQVHLQVAALAG